MFDERSFDSLSFDPRSWLYGVIASLVRRVKLLQAVVVSLVQRDIVVVKEGDEHVVSR